MKNEEKLLREWIKSLILSEVDVPTDFAGPKFSGGRQGGMFGRIKGAVTDAGKSLGDYAGRMAGRGIGVALAQNVVNNPMLYFALGDEGVNDLLNTAQKANLQSSMEALGKNLILQSNNFITSGIGAFKFFNIPQISNVMNSLASEYMQSNPVLGTVFAGFYDLTNKIMSSIPGTNQQQKSDVTGALITQWIKNQQPDPRFKNYKNVYGLIDQHHNQFVDQIKKIYPNIKPKQLAQLLSAQGIDPKQANFFQSYFDRT